MVIELPPLPWGKNSLEPMGISAETIDFHYGKHHAGYVTKLNAAIPGTPWENKSLEDIVKNATGGIFNNAAQIWNHTFYWNSLSPDGGGAPSGKVAEEITRDFGSFDEFKKQFTQAAVGHFGSGWAWLVKGDKGLEVIQTHDAESPLKEGKKPILTCDVWEHAYYIDFRNNRAAYIESWWKVVNWKFANDNLA